MEAVLRVRVPGISMPWKEVLRGCLVIVLFGVLYFCVHNCVKRNEGITSAPAGGAVEEGSVAVALEAKLPVIGELKKPAVTDMERELAAFEPALREAVKPVPVQNIPTVSYILTSDVLQYGFEDMDFTDVGSVPYEVLGSEAIDGSRTESVVTEEPPVMDVTDVPIENIVPENPSIPNLPDITDIPDEDVIPEEPLISEIAGFLLDDEGYITGYTERVVLRDGLLIIPESESLVGIRSGALEGLSENIMDVYLPANISDIEPGVFDVFPYLMFVEVSGDNPYYYSVNEILYSASGEEIFCPAGRTTE